VSEDVKVKDVADDRTLSNDGARVTLFRKWVQLSMKFYFRDEGSIIFIDDIL